jgi:hypothetical protein
MMCKRNLGGVGMKMSLCNVQQQNGTKMTDWEMWATIADLMKRLPNCRALCPIRETPFNLGRRPTMQKLIEVFLRSPNITVTRDDLVKEIYGWQGIEGRSLRYLNSLSHNAVKMVSRARIVMKKTFSGEGKEYIDWFPYDAQRKEWQLFRMKSEYFLQMMGVLE